METTAAALTLLGARLTAAPDSAILQLQVIEGEGAIFQAGSRPSRPLVVQVTDETGRPVAGAAVSFRLPDQDTTGAFRTGMKTEVVVTKPDGRASAHGIEWGRFPGSVRVRVTAAKQEARAGTVINVYISEGGGTKAARGRGIKWRWVAVAAGGAAAGVAAFSRGGAVAARANPVATPSVQVGVPTITVRQP